MTNPGASTLRTVAAQYPIGGTTPDHRELTAVLADVDWSEPVDREDLAALGRVLSALEARDGLGSAHRAAVTGVAKARPGWRLTHDRGQRGCLLSVGLSPDGRYLAVGGDEWLDDEQELGALQVWEVASGRCVNTLPVYGSVGESRAWQSRDRLRWHPSGTRVGSVYFVNLIGVFDPFGESAEPTVELVTGGLLGWTAGAAWCWSPDGQRMVVAWPWRPLEQQSTPAWFEAGLACLPLLDVEVSGMAGDGPDTAKPPAPMAQAEGGDDTQEHPVGRLDFTDDGRRLLGLRVGQEPLVLDVEARTRQRVPLEPALLAVAAESAGASFDPGGTTLALLDRASLVLVDVAAPGHPRTRRHELVGEVPYDTRWSPDGNRLAVLTDRAVHLFDPAAGTVLYRLPVRPLHESQGHEGDYRSLAFSGDGARVAVLTADERIEVWALAAEPRRLLEVASGPDLVGLVWADGDRAIVCWGPGDLVFVDSGGGRPYQRYQQQTDEWNTRVLAFHEDASHPLAYPDGNAGEGFDRDPAFAVPMDGRWSWITAFPTGLVVCPAEARAALAGSLSLVWERRVAWPAHWALGTDLLEVHEDWPAALASARLPGELPDAWRRHRAAQDPG